MVPIRSNRMLLRYQRHGVTICTAGEKRMRILNLFFKTFFRPVGPPQTPKKSPPLALSNTPRLTVINHPSFFRSPPFDLSTPQGSFSPFSHLLCPLPPAAHWTRVLSVRHPNRVLIFPSSFSVRLTRNPYNILVPARWNLG